MGVVYKRPTLVFLELATAQAPHILYPLDRVAGLVRGEPLAVRLELGQGYRWDIRIQCV